MSASLGLRLAATIEIHVGVVVLGVTLITINRLTKSKGRDIVNA